MTRHRFGLLPLLFAIGCVRPPDPCTPVAAEVLQAACLKAIDNAKTVQDVERIDLACRTLQEARCL
jgi:hypothetical protein